jgi:hypothetical protein
MAKIFKISAGLILLSVMQIGGVQAKPDEVTATAVTDCRLLGQVAGSSGYGKNVGWKPLAKASAEQKAAKLGATHIVFTGYRSVGSFNGEAAGNAYSCEHS